MATRFSCVGVLFTGAAIAFLSQPAWAGFIYVQSNLVSNGAVPAANTDANLINPWGLSFNATSPFWVSDQGAGVSTLYNGAGVATALVVTVPSGSTPPTGPTGQVFNSAPTGSFPLSGTSAKFIFDTLSGTIDAWNGGTAAAVEATTAGAVYTGLALDNAGTSYYLYAANSAGTGSIDVYDSNFNKVTLGGSFVDPNAIAGYVPFNIQNIGGTLYVEYAEVGPTGLPVTGSTGYVDEFDSSGNFISRLTTGGPLDAPWGIALAPATGFGTFSGDLLIGNFGNGEINAFNPTTGVFLGTLTNASGAPIVNQYLWALDFGNGGTGFSSTSLYFTAGVNNQMGGLFGSIAAVATPEPATLSIAAVGLLSIALARAGRRRRR
ncbi:MAG: TIGR03118 family protein [Bryobacteraceae bacterium]|jgi:uncharacterized protein (TIGR03118 family)